MWSAALSRGRRLLSGRRRRGGARRYCIHLRAAALAAVLLAGGCAPDRAADPPGLAARIEGIRAITYDGLDLVVEKAREGAGGSWALIGPQGESDMAVLRLGKEFALTDGRTFFTTYRVMSLNEEMIAFRKTTRLRRAGEGAADREIADVVQVRPYEP